MLFAVDFTSLDRVTWVISCLFVSFFEFSAQPVNVCVVNYIKIAKVENQRTANTWNSWKHPNQGQK